MRILTWDLPGLWCLGCSWTCFIFLGLGGAVESGGSWLISSWLIDSALFCCKPFMICCDLSSTSAASLEEHSWLIGRYLLGPRMGDAVGGKKPLPRLLLLTPARRRDKNQ